MSISMFLKVCITMSPLCSRTHLLAVSSMRDCVLVIDILGNWSSPHTGPLAYGVIASTMEKSNGNLWNCLPHLSNIAHQKQHHILRDGRQIKALKDLKKAGVRILLTVLFHMLVWLPVKTRWNLDSYIDYRTLNQGVATITCQTRLSIYPPIYLSIYLDIYKTIDWYSMVFQDLMCDP